MEQSFKIRAVSSTGKIIESSMVANSRDEVVSILKSRNQSPIQITEEATKNIKIIPAGLLKKKVKLDHLSILCRQLSAMLSAGMPINRALDIQVQQTENPTLKEALASVTTSIKQGEAMSKAMKAFPSVFPMILVTMIEAGELTGNIDEVLERMANHYVKENRTNKKVKAAMTYPIILIVVTVVVVSVMMVAVVPMFEQMFANSNMELPFITEMVLGFSRSIQKYWYIYISVIGGIAYFTKKYLSSKKGKYWFDSFKLNFKLINKAIKQIITSRFTRTMSTLLASGIPIVDAVQISAETTNNTIVIDNVSMVSDGIKRGMSLSSELKKTEMFPAMMLSMVSIGEETGNIDGLLLKTADYYDEELEEGIQKLVSLLEPAMIIVMAVVIGTVVIAIMVPMMTMNSTMPM